MYVDPVLEYYKNKTHNLKAQVKSLQNQISSDTPGVTSTKRMVLSRTSLKHTPYVYEVTRANKSEVEANTEMYFYIQDDDHRGLRSPGRNGYLKNDGPGVLQYKITDENGTSSFPATLKPGESDRYQYSDNVHAVIVVITVDTAETLFRMRWTSGLEEENHDST